MFGAARSVRRRAVDTGGRSAGSRCKIAFAAKRRRRRQRLAYSRPLSTRSLLSEVHAGVATVAIDMDAFIVFRRCCVSLMNVVLHIQAGMRLINAAFVLHVVLNIVLR